MAFIRGLAIVAEIIIFCFAFFGGFFLIGRGMYLLIDDYEGFINWLNDGNLGTVIGWFFLVACAGCWVYNKYYNKKYFLITNKYSLMSENVKGGIFHKVLQKDGYCQHLKNLQLIKGEYLFEKDLAIVSDDDIIKLEAHPCIYCFVFEN